MARLSASGAKRSQGRRRREMNRTKILFFNALRRVRVPIKSGLASIQTVLSLFPGLRWLTLFLFIAISALQSYAYAHDPLSTTALTHLTFDQKLDTQVS